VEAVVLSDVLGDRPDVIASGPTAADPSTCRQAMDIAKKYSLALSQEALGCLGQETPKALDNVHMQIIGSVRQLCVAAEMACRELGYDPIFLTDQLCCEAREAGRFLGSILRSHGNARRKTAFLAGGETVVHVTGSGKGGRNQELVLGAAQVIRGMDNACVISVGSDGTDGPTDAAGGYVDGDTAEALAREQNSPEAALLNNDAYPALKAIGGLIFTGPTGTNVNDIAVCLLQP
jgi:hydroxypyruvate reductase